VILALVFLIFNRLCLGEAVNSLKITIGIASSVLLALVLPTSAHSSPTPNPSFGVTNVSGNPNYVLHIDCSVNSLNDWADEGPYVYPVPGGSVTITTAENCTTAGIRMKVRKQSTNAAVSDQTGGYTVSGISQTFPTTTTPVVRTLVAMTNTNFEFFNPANLSDESLFIYVQPMSLAASDPSGLLMATDQITIPTVSPTSTSFPAMGSNCVFETQGGDYVYATKSISVTRSGDYSFRFVSVNPIDGENYWWGNQIDGGLGNPTLLLYSAFNPADPTQGLRGCKSEDDNYQVPISRMRHITNSGFIVSESYPILSTNLAAGNYTLVMTTYNVEPVGGWNYDQIGVIETWGPTAPASAPATTTSPVLATTGANADKVTSTFTAGIVAIVFGVVMLMIRRGFRRS
jgi:hypothetical protein